MDERNKEIISLIENKKYVNAINLIDSLNSQNDVYLLSIRAYINIQNDKKSEGVNELMKLHFKYANNIEPIKFLSDFYINDGLYDMAYLMLVKAYKLTRNNSFLIHNFFSVLLFLRKFDEINEILTENTDLLEEYGGLVSVVEGLNNQINHIVNLDEETKKIKLKRLDDSVCYLDLPVLNRNNRHILSAKLFNFVLKGKITEFFGLLKEMYQTNEIEIAFQEVIHYQWVELLNILVIHLSENKYCFLALRVIKIILIIFQNYRKADFVVIRYLLEMEDYIPLRSILGNNVFDNIYYKMAIYIQTNVLIKHPNYEEGNDECSCRVLTEEYNLFSLLEFKKK